MKQLLHNRVGDAEKDDELNRRISPLYHVDKIRAPLIIAQVCRDLAPLRTHARKHAHTHVHTLACAPSTFRAHAQGPGLRFSFHYLSLLLSLSFPPTTSVPSTRMSVPA